MTRVVSLQLKRHEGPYVDTEEKPKAMTRRSADTDEQSVLCGDSRRESPGR